MKYGTKKATEKAIKKGKIIEPDNTQIYWTASNDSSFLQGYRSAKNMLAAVRAARKYVRYELGEGIISYYNDCGEIPIRQDAYNIFTGYRWNITT